MNVDVRELGEQAAHTTRELGEQAAHTARELAEHAAHTAREVAEQAAHTARELGDQATHTAARTQDIVGELVDKTRDLEVPEPIERAADTLRRRPWPLLAGIGAAVVAVLIGRAWWHRRAERQQLAHLGTAEGRTDPFGPDARYQDRAVAAVS